MHAFYGGPVAFELLLSDFCWARDIRALAFCYPLLRCYNPFATLTVARRTERGGCQRPEYHVTFVWFSTWLVRPTSTNCAREQSIMRENICMRPYFRVLSRSVCSSGDWDLVRENR